MLNVTNSHIKEIRTYPVLEGTLIDNSYVLKRVDDGQGGEAVTIATGTAGEDIVGIAHVSPVGSVARAVVGEEHATPAGTGPSFDLNYVPVQGVGLKLYNETKDELVDAGAYSISGKTVTITDGQATTPAEGDIVAATYARSVTLSELAREGLPMDWPNRVTGQDGAVEVVRGRDSDIDVDFFDPAGDYQIGAPVYVSATGQLTSESGDIKFGNVTRLPSSGYPVLGVELDG